MTGEASETFEPELLRAPGRLADRAQEWDALATATPSPFLTAAWLQAWWEASPQAVRCLLLHDGSGRLRAGALVVRHSTGVVRGAADVHSGDWGVVGTDADARAAAWRELAALAHPVGRLLLPSLDHGALESARGALEPLGHRVVELDRLDSPALTLPASHGELLAGVSRNLRSQLGRSRRALERDGRLVLRTTTRIEGLEHDLEVFLRLEASGWKGRMGTAVLSTPRTAALYRRFARLAAAAGSLRLHLLELDGVAVAGDLACRVAGRSALVKTAFDETRANDRPGLVLRAEALRAAIAEGADEYDFLGAPDAYKTRWGAELRPRSTVLAARGPWRAELLLRERGRPALGRLRRRVSPRPA